LGAFLFAERK